jgi:hypothetical protein
MFDHRRRNVLGLGLSLLAAACAAQRAESVPSVERLTREDLKYQAVQVEPFTITPKGVKAQDPEAYLRKAQETCVKVLTRSGLFDAVAAGPAADAPEGALLVRAELQSLNVPSGGKRQWLGGLAGRTHMNVRVFLTDAQTGTVFKSVLVEQDAETAGGPWSFGATDRSLPAEVGTRIAETAALGAKK